MKILISGSRNWVDQGAIERELKKYPPKTILIHGGCRGVDNIAGYVAEQLGFRIHVYPAGWAKYGKGAGHIRNQLMLDREHPDGNGKHIDVLLVWHEDPGLGRGTKDMVRKANAASPAIDIQVRGT